MIGAQEARIRAVELANAATEPRLDALTSEVDGLRKRANAWGSINTVFAAFATAVGWQK